MTPIRRLSRSFALAAGLGAAVALSVSISAADEMKKKEKAPESAPAKPAPAKPAAPDAAPAKPAPAKPKAPADGAKCDPKAGVNTLEDLYAYIGKLERLQGADASDGESEPTAATATVLWREVTPADAKAKAESKAAKKD